MSRTPHVRKDEDDDSEAHSWDVQACKRPLYSREETGGMSMGWCRTGVQREKVEAWLHDVSGRRERLYGNFVDFLAGIR
jgi:hypothetical protein